jgi:DtxR family Mn-dependent transcriptional regulator
VPPRLRLPLQWHAIAEEGEHRLSPAEANALAASLANPSHDPHGDPIPTAEGWFAAPPGQPLSSLAAGQSARIVHLEDEPAVIYSQILAEGLHTGLELRVMESTPARLRFWAGGDEHVLAPLLANNISVVPLPDESPAARAGMPLNRLNPGDSARVLALAPAIRGAERRRLLDLGLIPGTQISAELRSPSGDPTAYLVRGALIALRADQARHIRVESTPVRN